MTGACLSMQNSHTNMKAYQRGVGDADIYQNVADLKKRVGNAMMVARL